MDTMVTDLLVGLGGCLAVGALALAGVFRRLGRRGRVILTVGLTLLVLLACLSTQLGAIRATLSQQSSPSDAILVATTTSDTGQVTLSGLSARDGSARWQRPLDLFQPSGIVSDGVIYMKGATHADDTAPAVEALRLSDGAPLWRLALPGERLTTAMCAANGLLILTAYMSFSPLTIDALAINVNTHALAWRASIPSLPALSGYAPLAADAGLLFVGSLDGSVRALRLSDGSLAWKMRISATATSDPGATGPVSLGVATRDGLLIVYDSTGEVVSVRPGDGATLWGRPLALVTYAPGRVTLTGSSLYVCGVSAKTALRTLIALDPATGATRWSRPAACALAAPIESGAYLYTLDGFSLTVVRASDGSFVWHGAPAENDLGYVDLSSDSGVIFVATTIANYRALGFCSDWWRHGIPFCHSSAYIAAFNGATGQSYWRADGYDHLLGLT